MKIFLIFLHSHTNSQITLAIQYNKKDSIQNPSITFKSLSINLNEFQVAQLYDIKIFFSPQQNTSYIRFNKQLDRDRFFLERNGV